MRSLLSLPFLRPGRSWETMPLLSDDSILVCEVLRDVLLREDFRRTVCWRGGLGCSKLGPLETLFIGSEELAPSEVPGTNTLLMSTALPLYLLRS